MIRERNFEVSDIPEISSIHRKQPELGVPSLTNVLVNKTFVDEFGSVVGYGVLKVFSEAVLIINQDISKLSKGKVLRLGMKTALDTCKKNHIEQLYIITSFPGFDAVLQKHYNARLCTGKTLLINV